MSSKVLIYTEILYMTLYMCFIYTLVIHVACTVSVIVVQIDHKGPNWTFLALKLTFRVMVHTFRILAQALFTPKKLHDAIHFGSTSLLMIMGKWAKSDLSDLENDLSNNSIKSTS